MLMNPTGGPIRDVDLYGSGAFGASRSPSRQHKGVDYVGMPGQWIILPSAGTFDRYGFPYSDALGASYNQYLAFRGVMCGFMAELRLFYVRRSSLGTGGQYERGQVVGRLASLQERYPGITEHCHLDMRNLETGEFVDVTLFMEV